MSAARKVALVVAAAGVLVAPSGCRTGDGGGERSSGDRTAPVGATAAAPTSAAPSARPEFVPAGEGKDAAAIVARELERADREHRDLLVYVGGEWCEPCQRFHKALERGELDRTFPNLRFVEFELPRDEERLRAAGYASRLIPLFAIPSPDGRSSGAKIEGSIKGDGAVDDIVPRLRHLLAKR